MVRSNVDMEKFEKDAQRPGTVLASYPPDNCNSKELVFKEGCTQFYVSDQDI